MTSQPRAPAATSADAMAGAARDLLDALDGERAAEARFAFPGAGERTSWYYYPTRRNGVEIGSLDPARQKLVHRLLSTGLSLQANAKACAIIALEDVLDRMERGAFGRSPSHYRTSVFGDPGSDAWGWRFEGHHVCVNVTVAGSRVSTTPLFLGANPATVRHGSHEALRPLREEEEAARDLLGSMDDAQRAAAVLTGAAPADIVSGNLAQVPDRVRPGDVPGLQDAPLSDDQREALTLHRDRPAGIASSQLDARQRELLAHLVAVYVERAPRDLAGPEVQRLASADVHFAWAGPLERGRGHYYRLQAPGFLAEYDNTQNDANHVHAVWRAPGDDFGAGLLAGHA